ncbi:hypothetical protein QAD02_021599 [Eretmocerus hayati]|uniref:Uncharacterized protein n=1 Tax=Eretmocerus hayati TaxID=131215 RepID=A0ACC2PQM3_9HYME|nr:hypothetical protein QAD02_021599 [Eretmocerus hayati]
MALRNLLTCFICEGRFAPQNMSRIDGPYLVLFLKGMRTVSRKRERFHDPLNPDDNKFVCLTSLRKDQIEDLFTFCDPVPCWGGHRYVEKLDLIAFLAKLHQGLSDEFLKVLFEYRTRQATSLAMATTRQSLMQRFVPTNIGFGSITREEFIQRHVTEFAHELYNPHPEESQAILIIDVTLIIGSDGHILDVRDPHFADARNNDAAMLRDDLGNEDGPMRHWIRAGDIILVERAYRDIEDLFVEPGLRYYRPAFFEAGGRQLSTQDANQSRIVTKMRYVVEARNGHIKFTCKFLNQMMQIQHIPHLGDFDRLAEAMINRYHPPIIMQGADAQLARRMLDRARQPNALQARVENENLATRNAQRWVRLDDGQLNDSLILTEDYVRDLTVGVYQITYTPAANDDAEHRMEVDAPPIEDYYCLCMSGARTLGTCAHVVCVMWYLGFARHDPNVHYPSQILLDQ